MIRACSMQDMRNSCKILVEMTMDADHMGDLSVHGRIPLRLTKRIRAIVDRIHLAHDRDQWRTSLNMNFSSP
jgi:hypothetical protein